MNNDKSSINSSEYRIAEYTQLNEWCRHNDRYMLNNDRVYTSASLAILAFTLTLDIGNVEIIAAFIVSIILYGVNIFLNERILAQYMAAVIRIKEIEKLTPIEGLGHTIRFQTRYDNLITSAQEFREYRSRNPVMQFIIKLAQGTKFGATKFRSAVLYLLFLLWFLRLAVYFLFDDQSAANSTLHLTCHQGECSIHCVSGRSDLLYNEEIRQYSTLTIHKDDNGRIINLLLSSSEDHPILAVLPENSFCRISGFD